MAGKLLLRSSTGRQLPACVVLFQLLAPRVGGTAPAHGRHRPSLRASVVLPPSQVPAGEAPQARKRRLESMELLAANYNTDSSGEDEQRSDKAQVGRGVEEGQRGDMEPDSKRQCRSRLSGDETGSSRSSREEGPAPEVAADGRVRSFPHVEGNYAGFIYVPVRSIDGLEAAAVNATRLAQSSLTRLWKSRQCSGNQPLVHRMPLQELHLSVSRTFALRRRQIEPVVEQLRKTLQASPCFDVALSGVDLYTNDEQTRSFVGLSLSSGRARMQATTRAVDHVLSNFSLEPFYNEMRFHVSVAWFAGPVPEGLPVTPLCADGAAGEETSGRRGCHGESVSGKECKDGESTVRQEAGGGVRREQLVCEEGQPPVVFSVKGLEAKIGKKKYALRFKDG